MHATMLVEPVSLGLEERALGRRVGPVQATSGRDHPPPREVRRAAEDVGHRLPAPGPTDLLGQLAVGGQLAGPEVGDGGDDRPLERGGIVVIGPGVRVRRERRRQAVDPRLDR